MPCKGIDRATRRGGPCGSTPRLATARTRTPAAGIPRSYVIQGYTGQLDMWWNRSPFRWNFPELTDLLFAGDDAPPPALVVFVDCWTSVGGSQFLDSPALGDYHTYLCDEVVPWVDQHYRTLATREHRGIAGKSSGGYARW
jgi:S-formylglutathione hydrolase FrmB